MARDASIQKIARCSHCFHNEGLRLEALKLGERPAHCSRCGSQTGTGLNEEQCGQLLERFFIDGSRSNDPFGVSPYMNGLGNPHDIHFDQTLQSDFEMLISIDALGLRRRSPKTYLVGDTEHWGAFQAMVEY